jgi:hypothetical protein
MMDIPGAAVHQNHRNQHTLVPDVRALMQGAITQAFHGSKFNPVICPAPASKPGVSSWVQPIPKAPTRFITPDVLNPLNGRDPVSITVKFQTGTYWNLGDHQFTLNSTNDTGDTIRTFKYLRVAVAQYTGAEHRDVILTNQGTPIDLKQPLAGDQTITVYFRTVVLDVPIAHNWDTDSLSEFHIEKYPFAGYRFVFLDEKGRRTIAVRVVDWFDGLPMSSRNALAARAMLFVPGLTSTHLVPIHMFLAIDQSEESMRYDKTVFNQDIMIRAMLKLADQSFPIVPPDLVSDTTPQLWLMIRGNTMTIDKHAAAKWTGQTGAINQDWSSVCRVCSCRGHNCNDLAKHMHLHFPIDHVKAHFAGKSLAGVVKKHLKRGDKDDMIDNNTLACVTDMCTVGVSTTARVKFIKAWKQRGRGHRINITQGLHNFINSHAHGVFGGIIHLPPIFANSLAEPLRNRMKAYNGKLHTEAGVLKTSYATLFKSCMSEWNNIDHKYNTSVRLKTRAELQVNILLMLGIKPPEKNFACGRTWREFFQKDPALLRLNGRPSKLSAVGIALWRLNSQLSYLFNHFDGSDPSMTDIGLSFAVTHAIHHINEALRSGCTTDEHRNHNHYSYAHATTDLIERGLRPMVDTAEDSLEAMNKRDKHQAKKLSWRTTKKDDIDGTASVNYTTQLLELFRHIWISRESQELFNKSKRSPDKNKSIVPMQMTENLILCPATLTGTHPHTSVHIRTHPSISINLHHPAISQPSTPISHSSRIHPAPYTTSVRSMGSILTPRFTHIHISSHPYIHTHICPCPLTLIHTHTSIHEYPTSFSHPSKFKFHIQFTSIHIQFHIQFTSI